MSQTETSFFLAERQVSVRGYNSVSEMYSFGKELGRLIRDGVYPVILYLGDHDPSGINMPLVAARDLTMYAGAEVEVVRLALNLDQVQELNLPPNFAKETDKRFPAYVREFGTQECWELDALEPTMIDQLLREAIEDRVDAKKWRAAKARERKNKSVLAAVLQRWDTVAGSVRGRRR